MTRKKNQQSGLERETPGECQLSFSTVQEETIADTEETAETNIRDKLEQNQPSEIPTAVTRPRRDRKRPHYLKDNVTSTVLSLCTMDIDIMPLNIFCSSLEH